jgi:hypothetical protein
VFSFISFFAEQGVEKGEESKVIREGRNLVRSLGRRNFFIAKQTFYAVEMLLIVI